MGAACFGGLGVVEAVVVRCVGMLSIMGKMRRIEGARKALWPMREITVASIARERKGCERFKSQKL